MFSDELQEEILENINNEDLSTEELVRKAKAYIRDLSGDICVENTEVKAASVLQAMLNHAPCTRGTRYAACAIIYCSIDSRHNLANDWCKFFLFPLRMAYMNSTPPHSDQATPTIADTQGSMTVVKTARPGSFRDLVEKRQQGQCAVIQESPNFRAELEAAHIINRSLARERVSQTFSPSVLVTWDIIRQYANIAVDELESKIDAPENGILLEVVMHRTFEKFHWCFVPTEKANEYNIKMFQIPPVAFYYAGRKTVTFKNHSHDPITLPKSEYLALHTATAHILDETGLGEFINGVIDCYLPNSSAFPLEKFTADDLPLRIAMMKIFSTPPPPIYSTNRELVNGNYNQ